MFQLQNNTYTKTAISILVFSVPILLGLFFAPSLTTPAQTPADRAALVQQELSDLAAAGVDGALYWMYSGSRDQEFAFGSDLYSFFKGDPICGVLRSNVGNFSFLGVNIPSIGTANGRVPGAAEDAINYLSSDCGINMIRIFGFPDRGGVAATTAIVNLAQSKGMRVIVALCDYANGCADLGITGSTQIDPTSWYTTGYTQTYGGPNYSGSYLDYAREMAQALAGNPGLYAIELLNEPHCGGVVGCISAYANWAQTVASEIRSRGVSRVGIGQMASQPTTRGDSPGAGSPPDFIVSNQGSSLNVASAHYYNDSEKTSALLANTQADSGALSNIQEFYIGEFGVQEVPPEADMCVYSPWTPFCANVSTPQLYCACDGTSCEPFEPAGFVAPNDIDVGQDDGTGKPIFRVFDRDTENYYDIPPVLHYTSPGSSACGPQSPPGSGSGPGTGPGGGTCNPFNCFRDGVIDFATSLECAADTIDANLGRETWDWFDSYGPYCHNETYARADGSGYIMPFGYNFWDFFDRYLPPSSTGGRTPLSGTCEQPPSADEIRNSPRYAGDVGMACPAQGDPVREPGHPAFNFYRGALVDCPLVGQNNGYAAGSFGMDPEALRTHLTTVLNVHYMNFYLSSANQQELLSLLREAQERNINPFILLGLWATESLFGQNGGCNGGGGGTPPPVGAFGLGIGCSSATSFPLPVGQSGFNRFHWDGYRPVDLFAKRGVEALAPITGTAYPYDSTGGYAVMVYPTDSCQPAVYSTHMEEAGRASGPVTAGDRIGTNSHSGSACKPCDCTTGAPGCNRGVAGKPPCNGQNGGECSCNPSNYNVCSGAPHVHFAASTTGNFYSDTIDLCSVEVLANWGYQPASGPLQMCCNPDHPDKAGCFRALNQ